MTQTKFIIIITLIIISILTCCIDGSSHNTTKPVVNNNEISHDTIPNHTNTLNEDKNIKNINNSNVSNSKLNHTINNDENIAKIIKPNTFDKYPIHKNITSTVFWIGEGESSDNGYIQNYDSVWDDDWMEHYGGVDDPYYRNGFYPADFIPKENSFYVALPYNDFEDGVKKDTTIYKIYWSSKPNKSTCKNRWIKITKGNISAYAQWEDAGPFGEDDYDYVFGDKPNNPKNKINNNAGIDVSPAVRDYLNLSDIDKVDWQFVDYKDVPDGDWKKIITKSNIYWR